jgi:hypothetical protein
LKDERDYYDVLREHCQNDHQRNKVDALERAGGNKTKAAGDLGISLRNYMAGIKRVEIAAAKAGYAPQQGLNHPIPPGQAMKGISALVDERSGESVLTWYKTHEDKEAANAAVLAAIESACETIKPARPVKPRGKHNKDLLSMYVLTDFHLGMYAWGEETGDDWDADIARRVLMNAFDDMIATAPKSDTAVFAQMGDFLHWDGLDAVTPTSKHILDADTRFDRLAELALSSSIEVVDKLLLHHRNVKVLACEGNHDIASSVWIRKALKYYYRKQKRVEVDDRPYPYYAMLWGVTMLGWHHGHKKAIKNLAALFASEPRFREMWGKAKQCYIHVGHLHHEEKLEDGGAVLERHPTLAARDAHAARGGWVSNRGTSRVDYHTEDGEVSRFTVRPRAA